MGLRIAFIFLTVWMVLASAGCSSNKEKIDGICSRLKDASEMTDNCSAMAKKVMPLTKKFESVIADLDGAVPDENERPIYIDAISQCLSAYNEIKTGPCGKDPDVLQAMPNSK